jgi:dipeptidyl aminopeptidase/acylaminoacyl peptidase
MILTEAVRGSTIPVQLMYVETIDGLYAPIGLRVPPGEGPFPLILFASGNGGGGMAGIRNDTQNRSWTQERFIEAGYAVAWLRYRAEVDYAYDKIGKLVVDKRSGGILLNRGPLEYEDVIAIAEHLKTLPAIDAGRVGYMGMSHAGEMALKIASDYHGFRAMVATEPAAHEFLRLRPGNAGTINAATGFLDAENMLMHGAADVRGRITEDVAKARFATISTPIFVQGRNGDNLQGIFRVCYDLLIELGKDAEWKTYEHEGHGFVYPSRNEAGLYNPDATQITAVNDAMAFLTNHIGH